MKTNNRRGEVGIGIENIRSIKGQTGQDLDSPDVEAVPGLSLREDPPARRILVMGGAYRDWRGRKNCPSPAAWEVGCIAVQLTVRRSSAEGRRTSVGNWVNTMKLE